MSSATTHWPLFALEIRTPRLTLRYLDDEQAAALMDLAATGVHDPAEMPFSVPWTRHEPPYLQQQGMQHFWSMRAGLSADDWTLQFAVYEDDRLVGTQSIVGKAFLVTRTVESGSWLGRTEQGKGIGKEMRAAVLHLAFAGLAAECAVTSAFADNPRSLGVTRALGYRENGWFVDDREGKPAKHLRFIMERADWEQGRRDDIEISNLEPGLRMLGLAPNPPQP
jgi:RimJ/RimL family protein N-acetyltransferase